MGEISGSPEVKAEVPEHQPKQVFDLETESLFNDLFKDDYEGINESKNETDDSTIDAEAEMNALFADDYIENAEVSDKTDYGEQEYVDLDKQYEPNDKFEINGQTYETDDNGYIYRINEYELVPDREFTIDGVTYKTDDQGRTVSVDGDAKSTPDGERDHKAQTMAGGEDRKEGDQGGHILARILGGSRGIENIVAMRGPINQGPYHTMEKEISDALKEGKEVHVHVEVKYEDDSKRPSKMSVVYTIDGKETVVEYDNDEGSTELLDSIEDKVDEDEYNDLKQEVEDANEDGGNISIIAVKTEYDENGNAVKISVVMRDDNSDNPKNETRVLTPREAA